jgi:tripartite-type tricarboxylate transporter receptor subunit TctC
MKQAWRPGIVASSSSEIAARPITVLVGPSGPMIGNPAIYTKLSYDPIRDFVPVTMIGSIPLILVVNSSLPVKSVQELVAYAKAHSKSVNYSSVAALFHQSSIQTERAKRGAVGRVTICSAIRRRRQGS